MDDHTTQTLTQIQTETATISAVQREELQLLRTMAERTDEILALLRPDEDGRDGVPLDEILAHLVAQGREMIRLLQTHTKFLTAIEKRLPPEPVPVAANGADPVSGTRQ